MNGIDRMAAAATIAVLSGEGHRARYVRELLDTLPRAGHAIHELGHDLSEDAEEARTRLAVSSPDEQSETLCTWRSSLHGNWDISGLTGTALPLPARIGKARSRSR
jgi:hypothetical protein